jgi:transcriptional regulator with XRE-family HTH domain
MDIREILARNLRKLRQARGISQEELAHRAEIDRTYISALERSVYAASIDVLDRIARVLNVEASDLLKRPPPTATKKGRGPADD